MFGKRTVAKPRGKVRCPLLKGTVPLQETQEMQVRSLGWEDPLEEEMATHSGILSWEIPWREQPGGLQSMGSQRIRHDWTTTYLHRSRQMINEDPVCVYAQSRPTLCDPMDCSLPGSFLHGSSQARILECIAVSSSRRSSWPRGWICLVCLLHWLVDSLPRSHLRSHKDPGLLINEWMWLQVLELLGGVAATVMQGAKQAL